LLRKQRKTLGIHFFLPHPVDYSETEIQLWTTRIKHSSSKRLDRGLKHECCVKLIHITAHLSLGIRLCGVRILVVRSLPVGQSAGSHFTTARLTSVPSLKMGVLLTIFLKGVQYWLKIQFIRHKIFGARGSSFIKLFHLTCC